MKYGSSCSGYILLAYVRTFKQYIIHNCALYRSHVSNWISCFPVRIATSFIMFDSTRGVRVCLVCYWKRSANLYIESRTFLTLWDICIRSEGSVISNIDLINIGKMTSFDNDWTSSRHDNQTYFLFFWLLFVCFMCCCWVFAFCWCCCVILCCSCCCNLYVVYCFFVFSCLVLCLCFICCCCCICL